MPITISPTIWKGLTFFWLTLTTILLVMPGNAFPKVGLFSQIPYFDKWVHIFLFGVLTALSLKAIRPSKFWGMLLLLVFILLYGVITEYVQLFFTTSRSFDGQDIVADGIGAMLGWILYRVFGGEALKQKHVKPTNPQNL